ncbi:copper amine oxidase N-terminal domain-containing protein [Anaerotignum sp.]|uniref:copper amine oxidase N-terminal domain-containing protein n=1 Tax=Anaerotignum sp. TaxID=2039241 RepID=UPI002A9179A9|nr:copper amine oxidase N-terminal domain-containing protein [Anaerotignum sp.]MCI7658116.1 copper amine oxidase N-terminal domain-containing protein [Clostridia bacterium]MDY5414281.1 copper amine oxidase N-terminal domain-containing protein [Anaerotignum sp.]
MKRFISFAMASVMAASMVPATAFAATGDVKATAKVVGAENYTENEMKTAGGKIDAKDAAELQLTFTTADYSSSSVPDAEIEMTLDKANFRENDGDVVSGSTSESDLTGLIYLKDDDSTYTLTEGTDDFGGDSDADYAGQYIFADKNNNVLKDASGNTITISDVTADDVDELSFTLTGKMERGWVLSYNLTSQLTKTSKNTQATVSVDSSDMIITNGDDLVYAAIEAKGIKVSVKDTVDVAVEEVATLKDITIEPSVGTTFTGDRDDTLTLKLNSGFEFVVDSNTMVDGGKAGKYEMSKLTGYEYDDDEITFKLCDYTDAESLKITGLKVEATSAKEGAAATMKVSVTGNDSVSVEVAKVVDYAVSMSVDKDEDVPVIYSGVDVDNTGITDDSDHESLEVSIDETFAGAWDNSKKFTLSLPEGVYAADVDVVADGIDLDRDDFIKAYDNGEYEYFEFDKRIFEENESGNDPYELDVTFTLVADPDFEGDVILTLAGDAMEEQEVTIAKFVKPYTVSAQQNDLTIDYRNTEIPTDIVITEAEAGLWEKGSEFALTLDKIDFDDDATVTADDKSGMEVKDVKTKDGEIRFTVDSESDDEPATLTVSDLTLYMDRNLPAGAYDLNMYALDMLGVDSAEKAEEFKGSNYKATDKGYLPQTLLAKDDETVFVGDESDDIDYTAKTGFVNIVTGGSDMNGFTTKLTVPIGENYLMAGETKVELDAPAYINANGYTMLPIRAISTSLGIDNNNVLWDQATKTVTILYADRIISMTQGASVMYVNGSSIPTSSTLEIVNDRAFLPMRDLSVALGVTDLTWDTDPATGKTTTVYMNANR